MATDPSDPAVDTVRTLTGLTDTELTDAAIAALLDLNGLSVRRAAADGLESVASTLLDVSGDDISLTGTNRARLLMARAKTLREQADDDEFTFDVVFPASCGTAELTERGCLW